MNQTDAVFGSFDDDTSNGKFITQSASADPGPLQRAEWIEYVSLFFSKYSYKALIIIAYERQTLRMWPSDSFTRSATDMSATATTAVSWPPRPD
jgi:hypothetical protein